MNGQQCRFLPNLPCVHRSSTDTFQVLQIARVMSPAHAPSCRLLTIFMLRFVIQQRTVNTSEKPEFNAGHPGTGEYLDEMANEDRL